MAKLKKKRSLELFLIPVQEGIRLAKVLDGWSRNKKSAVFHK